MMRKKILSLVVVMAMVLSFMPVIAQAATSGTCGAKLTWTLDDEGTLTISGEGAMKDWVSSSATPWSSSRSSIKNVIIGNSVTSIGLWAFCGYSSLESVVIPDSVTSIGKWAFSRCDNLTDIYYSGTEEEWNAIEIDDNNDKLLNATIHYNSVMPTTTAMNGDEEI